jgi:hypothetical protein
VDLFHPYTVRGIGESSSDYDIHSRKKCACARRGISFCHLACPDDFQLCVHAFPRLPYKVEHSSVLNACSARCTGVVRCRFTVIVFQKLGGFPLEIIRIHAYSWSMIPTPPSKSQRVTRLLQHDFNHGPFSTPIEGLASVLGITSNYGASLLTWSSLCDHTDDDFTA